MILHYLPTETQLSDINHAFRKASKSQHRCRHGAVVRASSHRSFGFNIMKNDPRYVDSPSRSVHAEEMALRLHSSPRRGICVSVRLDQSDNPAYAKPCKVCESKLAKAGIKRVIFTNPDSATGYSLISLK